MGPMAGVKVVELVGLGPGPFAGMLLADMGAEVLRVDRVDEVAKIDHSLPATNAMNRGKRSMAIDLKRPEGVETLLRLVDRADAFFEVFRPGVAERLGIGPDVPSYRDVRAEGASRSASAATSSATFSSSSTDAALFTSVCTRRRVAAAARRPWSVGGFTRTHSSIGPSNPQRRAPWHSR